MRFCARCRRVWRDEAAFCPADGAPMKPVVADDDPLVGLELDGRYRLDSLLGQGGMGFVYLADQLGLGRRVAIKMLFAERMRDDAIVRRFRREARALAALSHPNVVGVLDVGDGDGASPYIVMELVTGRPLARILLAHERLEPAHALQVGAQLADALAAAHARGIVHRDLKPANIHLEDRDGELLVRILDFGLALLAEGSSTGSTGDVRLTRQGVVAGTPEYMAPEQIKGGEVDARTDLYALGIVLHEMLRGDAPFVAPSPAGVLAMQLETPPPPLEMTDAPQAASERIEGLVSRLLAKRRVERPDSAQVVAQELREILEMLPDAGSAVQLVSRPSVARVASVDLGKRTTDHADRDLEPTRSDTGVGTRAPGAAHAAQARAERKADGTWSGIAASAHGDRLLAAALGGEQRRRRIQLALFVVLGGGLAAVFTVFLVNTLSAARSRAEVGIATDMQSGIQRVQPLPRLVADPAPPTVGPLNIGESVPGGNAQLDYESQRRRLEHELTSRGLRLRDLRAVADARAAWDAQDQAARRGAFAQASAQLTRLSGIAAAVSTEDVLAARVAAAGTIVRARRSTLDTAALSALQSTTEHAARSRDATRAFLRRLDRLERGGRGGR